MGETYCQSFSFLALTVSHESVSEKNRPATPGLANIKAKLELCMMQAEAEEGGVLNCHYEWRKRRKGGRGYFQTFQGEATPPSFSLYPHPYLAKPNLRDKDTVHNYLQKGCN